MTSGGSSLPDTGGAVWMPMVYGSASISSSYSSMKRDASTIASGPFAVPFMYEAVRSYGTGRRTIRDVSRDECCGSSPPKLRGILGCALIGSSGDQDGGGDHRGPAPALVAHGRLRDAHGAVDLVADLPDLLALVVGGLRIELDPAHRRQHLGRQVLGVVARQLLRLPEGMVLAEIAVAPALARRGDADRRGA